MKKINRLFALLLSVLLCVLLIPTAVAADDDVIASGACEGTTWTLTKDGVLTVSGNGPIKDKERIEYDEDGYESTEKLDSIDWQVWAAFEAQTEGRSAAEITRARYDFVKALVIEEGVTEIPGDEFSNFYPREITLPLTLARIGNSAINADFATALTVKNKDTVLSSGVNISVYQKDATPYASVDEALEARIASEIALDKLGDQTGILYDLQTAYGILHNVDQDMTKAEYISYFNETYGKSYTTLNKCIKLCLIRTNRLLGTDYASADEIVEIVTEDGYSYVDRTAEVSDRVNAMFDALVISDRLDHISIGQEGYDDVIAYRWLTVYAPGGSSAKRAADVSGVSFQATTDDSAPEDQTFLGKVQQFFAKVKAFFASLIERLTAPFRMLSLLNAAKE